MEQLISSIYQTLEDYREDENRPLVRMTTAGIKNWINQFDNELRVPILIELDHIFKKRYCSKSKVMDFLDKAIQVLTIDFNFKNASDFLKNTNFLNLQPEGKSQKIMLSLFEELIHEKYGLTLMDCATNSKKYSIYIDDILCTGLTLISDIKEWSEKDFTAGKTNKQAVADGSTVLVFAYVFIHTKNYYKKKAEMKFKISNEVANNHKMYRMTEIENGIGKSSKIDLLYPLENGQPQSVLDYKNEIIERVNNYTTRYGTISSEEFYRPTGQPANDDFFTSEQNRIIVENAFLEKGIEILRTANPNNKNIRALGYSIPALKNFGFGALCFTWRNVPNNAPLVFWYSGGSFTPLFKVTRGGSFFLNVKSVNEFYFNSLNDEWKEIIKWNCIGLDTEEAREKVFNNDYTPSKNELDKIETLDELWINWWENDPPNDEYGVSDLSPIKNFKNLSSLVVRSLNVEDCNPISNCKNLKSLLIQHSKTKKIDFLTDLIVLEVLDLRYNPISDSKPIGKLINLISLDLSSTDIGDIDSISNLVKLQSLSLSNTNITTLEPLSYLNCLKELWLGNTGITSIQPLFGLNLENLVLNNENIANNEVTTFVNTHPKCRVYFKGKAYNENKDIIDFDLPF